MLPSPSFVPSAIFLDPEFVSILNVVGGINLIRPDCLLAAREIRNILN
jgi:hypothetical protein